jgi:hypothetical protein
MVRAGAQTTRRADQGTVPGTGAHGDGARIAVRAVFAGRSCPAKRCRAPQPPVLLRDVRPPRRPRLVAPAVNPVMQVPEAARQVLPVVLPRHPVHPRRGLRAQVPVGHHQPFQADVVQQRGEPRVLIPSCHFTHAVQAAWHAWPRPVSGACRPVHVPLGQSSFLRSRTSDLVRRHRRYYGTDCLTSHGRSSQACGLSLP